MSNTIEQRAEAKTAQEILDSKDLHWTYWPCGDSSKPLIHDRDCRFCESEDRVLEAMEEYAAQQQSLSEARIKELEEALKTSLDIAHVLYKKAERLNILQSPTVTDYTGDIIRVLTKALNPKHQ